MADLVLLQMPDEMPAGAPRKQWDFRFSLLHPAFPEQELPRLHRLLNRVRGMRLGDGDEFDVPRSPSGARGGFRDGRLNSRQTI